MHRLLLVEDDPIIGRGLQLSLRAEGYDVTLACTAAGAREKLADAYEVILLDVTLPDGNGLDLCRLIREKDPRTPILFVSAQGDEDTVKHAMSLGANDFICKPFSTATLSSRLKTYIS